MKKEKSVKTALVEAFDESDTKSIVDLCRIAGVSRGTFYFHYYKDADFRKDFLTKQQEYLAEKIATA